MNPRSVFVTGATGQQGGAVANALLSGEYGEFDVHALTRNPDSNRAQTLSDRGATITEGNLLHKDSLSSTVKAVDAVYCVTTPAEGVDAEIEQGTNMVEVAADGRIEHFVFSSARGAERDTGIPHFDSKYAVEQRIRDLELPATIIRPVAFMQNYEYQREVILNGTLASPLDEGVPLQLVDTEDIGTLAATALATPETYVGETIELAGDEHTLESAAEVFSAVAGTKVNAQHVPIEVAREEMGKSLTMMFEWLDDHRFDNNIEALERDHDINLTRFETYLREHGWASGRNQINK